jgi:hypothetical protein
MTDSSLVFGTFGDRFQGKEVHAMKIELNNPATPQNCWSAIDYYLTKAEKPNA